MSKMSIAILVVMLTGSVSLFGGNIFEKADSFNQVLDKAKSNKRLLLTYAAKLSVPCCVAMEKATFQNSAVKKLIKQSFYPVKINLSNELGKEWAQKFNIVNSPTLLFFDIHGTLIKQIENGVSSKELKSILDDVVFYNINGYWPMEEHPVVLTATVPHPPTIDPQLLACPIFKTPSKPASTFKILLDQVPTSDATIKEVVDKAKADYPEYPICVKLIRLGQNSYFQVLMGQFMENEKAQTLVKTLKASGFEHAKVFTTEEKRP